MFTRPSFAVSRLKVEGVPPNLDRVEQILGEKRVQFQEIEEGSEITRSNGVESVRRLKHAVWFMTFRSDRKRLPAGAVQNRATEKLEALKDQGRHIGPKATKKAMDEAAEELTVTAIPSTQRVQGLLELTADGLVLYVSTKSAAMLSTVQDILRRADWTTTLKTPWADRDDPPAESPLLKLEAPSSVAGCHVMRAQILDPDDADLVPEPETGAAKVMTVNGCRTLQGAVTSDLNAHLKAHAELLSVALLCRTEKVDASFLLDASRFTLSRLRFENDFPSGLDEDELLLEKLEQMRLIFGVLENTYATYYLRAA